MSDFIEFAKIIIPSFISVIGFFVTIYMNKNNLQTELNRHHIEAYMNNYKNIEYDIAEILQLSIKVYFSNDIYNKLEYIIQAHRTGEFALTDSMEGRLYRLGGYICTYGSRKAIFYLNHVRNIHVQYIANDNSKKTETRQQDFCMVASSLAILLLQIKQDIFMNKDYNSVNDEMDWLNTRLPVDIFKKYKNDLANNIRQLLQMN